MAQDVLLQIGPNTADGWEQYAYGNQRRKEKQLRENQPITASPELLLKGLLPAHAAIGWNGLVVPARTPPQLIARLNADIVAAIRSPEVQQRFAAFGVETIVSSPAGFDAFIREDMTRWADVIKRAGIKAEGAN